MTGIKDIAESQPPLSGDQEHRGDTEPRITFYQLRSKFVNQRTDIPETARQVLYTTLAVGHHVGVLDCFSGLVDAPLAEFQDWVLRLPAGPGRTKLEGLFKFGEIEINVTHAGMLLPLFADAEIADTLWAAQVSQCLQAMKHEPAIYLMARRFLD